MISASQELLAARKQEQIKWRYQTHRASEECSEVISQNSFKRTFGSHRKAQIEMLQDKLDIKESAKDLGRLHAHNKMTTPEKNARSKQIRKALLIKEGDHQTQIQQPSFPFYLF